MTQSPSRRPRVEDAAAIAAEAEGFLIAHCHREEARREAQALCARLPWLTTAQAEDLTRHYVNHRIALTRQILTTTAERAQELRGEYESRYHDLRRRLLKRYAAVAAGIWGCVTGICIVVDVLPPAR
ncbi:hypothetical protein AB0I94_33680 [Streptomyces sp. NPDC050147]|uniref:hypothetical protein n=1 Tax=Streptomyces sp. NPDC050147 TaxID=3155513 RepID=UPI003420F54E